MAFIVDVDDIQPLSRLGVCVANLFVNILSTWEKLSALLIIEPQFAVFIYSHSCKYQSLSS